MLVEAAGWWATRMAELVPERFRRERTTLANALIVTAESPAAIMLRNRHKETLYSAFVPSVTTPEALRDMLKSAGRDRAVLLRPGPESVLVKAVTLPLAAQSDLRRVLTYELNRITPFEPDEVFWNWSDCSVERQHRRLHLQLWLVPKRSVDPWLSALAAAGVTPSALEVVSAGGAARLIPLRHDPAGERWDQRVRTGLAATCAGLAAVAVALPFLQQSIALQTVEGRIQALKPQVDEAQTLRRRLAEWQSGSDTIREEEQKAADALTVLARLTRLLPDDTYLTDLSLRQRQLTLSGQSAAAARLIAGLSADPMFDNPGFAAPVTRNEAANRDVFSLHAAVKQ
jgi:general secretion pathway protein L